MHGFFFFLACCMMLTTSVNTERSPSSPLAAAASPPPSRSAAAQYLQGGWAAMDEQGSAAQRKLCQRPRQSSADAYAVLLTGEAKQPRTMPPGQPPRLTAVQCPHPPVCHPLRRLGHSDCARGTRGRLRIRGCGVNRHHRAAQGQAAALCSRQAGGQGAGGNGPRMKVDSCTSQHCAFLAHQAPTTHPPIPTPPHPTHQSLP